MKEINLIDFLKSELKEARNDYFERVNTQDKIKIRFTELATLTTKASTSDELIDIILKTGSWVDILKSFEKNQNDYLGDVPTTYLINSWKVFVEEWKPEFLRLKQRAEFKLSNINKQTQNKSEAISGFQSKLTDEQIESLYKQMQGEYFYTSLNNFKSIFNKELTNFTPIERTKKFTNTLLIYFTSELFQKENPRDYVSITEYCFNAKSLNQSQNNSFNSRTGKPDGYKQIDKIIQSIY